MTVTMMMIGVVGIPTTICFPEGVEIPLMSCFHFRPKEERECCFIGAD